LIFSNGYKTNIYENEKEGPMDKYFDPKDPPKIY
jgi:hypothetical protein